jgi:hypothetical protein
MEAIVPWNSEKYPAVGCCIYGADHEGPFTDEHIIPFGLLPKGGDWYLPEASCAGCADITKRFEDSCLRGTHGLLREQLGLKTRRKRNRGKPIELCIKKPDGTTTKITNTADALPKTCFSFKWHPPGLLRSGASRDETNFEGGIGLGYSAEELEPLLSDGHRLVLGRFRILDYARMLAKIAHGYAYAKCGIDKFEPSLLDIILGKDERAPYFIGGDQRGIPPAQPNVLHDIYPMKLEIGKGGP